MIEEILSMNGFGLYVWSAFFFTFISFTTLYMITKYQFIKERNKFVIKFGALDSKKADLARLQTINKEILSSSQSI
jgi:heme exporter protein D